MAVAERAQPPLTTSDTRNGGFESGMCPYPADPTFDELGYKVLLYLTRCFRGRVLGSSIALSETETAKVRKQSRDTGREGGYTF